MYKKQNSAKGGFTLIELLVVVLIIGILAAIALPRYQESVERARISEALSISKVIARANKRYFLATGSYANHIDQLDIDIPGDLVAGAGTGSRIQTKYFIYTASDADGRDFLVISQRIPASQRYYIYMNKTQNRLHCTLTGSPNEIQTKLCNLIEANGTL